MFSRMENDANCMNYDNSPSMISITLIRLWLTQIIKNLIFVAKTTYLISPESDIVFAQEEEEEKEEGKKEENEEENEEEENEEEKEEEGEGEKEEDEGEEDEEGSEARAAEVEKAEVELEEKQVEEGDQDDRPPSLLWIIKKLALMARREAANTPKIPLKVLLHSPTHSLTFVHSLTHSLTHSLPHSFLITHMFICVVYHLPPAETVCF